MDRVSVLRYSVDFRIYPLPNSSEFVETRFDTVFFLVSENRSFPCFERKNGILMNRYILRLLCILAFTRVINMARE